MNVLDAQGVPRVMGLIEVLRAFLDHQKDVLVRRTRFALARTEKRLHVLEGYLLVYDHLSEVIRIIREADEPKARLIKRFKLTEEQAEAVLNMRLRALRKLEEKEIRGEHKALSGEAKGLRALLKSEAEQWAKVADSLKALKARYGPKTPLGARRTTFAAAPAPRLEVVEAFVAREPITVICSAKGWIRALKGHVEPDGDIKYKEGDRARFALHAETTDKLLLLATNGRFYTLSCDKLPGGRGHGEPVKLMVELGESDDIVALHLHKPGEKLLVASARGYGFIVPADEAVAQKRSGKQVLNLAAGDEARACAPATGDTVAVIGENHKLLLFPLAEVPEMGRGRGVRLQRYREGGLSDIKAFARAAGLDWTDASGRRFVATELKDWLGARGQAGRLAPKGFPRSNRFSPR
jgi:topoisomerase-4 subunit A